MFLFLGLLDCIAKCIGLSSKSISVKLQVSVTRRIEEKENLIMVHTKIVIVDKKEKENERN